MLFKYFMKKSFGNVELLIIRNLFIVAVNLQFDGKLSNGCTGFRSCPSLMLETLSVQLCDLWL